MGRSLKDRRAVSSVIGAIFLITVLSLSMFAIFAYQGYFAGITREEMRSQQAISERIRENLEVTVIARSQDSAMLQIENTGLVTAKMTRAVIKDPDTGRSQISPLTYQLTLLPNEKQIVVISIPNGNGDEKIGLITARGKLYGAVPAPRMITLQSTTTGETNLNNPQPPANPSPPNPPAIPPPSSPSPSPSNPSPPSTPVSGSQPPATPINNNNQQQERVYTTLIPLRSNPYIEKIVEYAYKREPIIVPEEIPPEYRYIWEEKSTTYSVSFEAGSGVTGIIPNLVAASVAEQYESQVQDFSEQFKGENPPTLEDYVSRALENMAKQLYGEEKVELVNKYWSAIESGRRPADVMTREELQAFPSVVNLIKNAWWRNWEEHIVSRGENSITVRFPVDTYVTGEITIAKTEQTRRFVTSTPEPPTENAVLLEKQEVNPGGTEYKITGWREEKYAKGTGSVQTGTVLLDNEGNAWNVFRDPSGRPVLVRGSSEKTGEYTVRVRDANGNIVWLRPEDAERLMDVVTGQAENPGAIGGELPGTPQFDENGNLVGFVVERRETVTSSSGSSSSSSNNLANWIRNSDVGISSSRERVASYVESRGISSSSDLAAAYAAATGASYSEVLSTINSNPAVAAAVAAFLANNNL